jgi:hypothetical protein
MRMTASWYESDISGFTEYKVVRRGRLLTAGSPPIDGRKAALPRAATSNRRGPDPHERDTVLAAVKAWPQSPAFASSTERRPALTAAAPGVTAPRQVGTKKRSCGRTKKLTRKRRQWKRSNQESKKALKKRLTTKAPYKGGLAPIRDQPRRAAQRKARNPPSEGPTPRGSVGYAVYTPFTPDLHRECCYVQRARNLASSSQ